jgi:hypothetical protein
VWAVFLYTIILFYLPICGRCTRAVSGERWVLRAFKSERRSYVSGASNTNRLSSVSEILLNLVMSIALLKYPIAKLSVVYQLS